MACVRFTATRSLATGYSLNDTVTLNLSLASEGGLTRSRQPYRSVRRTISGKREVNYYSQDTSWAVSTIPLEGTDRDKVRMFLDSCEAGEVFLWSPYQVSSDNDLAFVNAMLDSEGWSESRTRTDGTTRGAADRFSYSFTIVQVS